MSKRTSAIAIAAVVALAIGTFLAGCGTQMCTDEYVSSLQLNFEDESGSTVEPERVVVTHEQSGDQKTRISECSPQDHGFGERAGTFTIRAECGDETVTRSVDVDGGECHVNTESVTLTFPDGACGACSNGN